MAGHALATLGMFRDEKTDQTVEAGAFLLGEFFKPLGQSLRQLYSRFHDYRYPAPF